MRLGLDDCEVDLANGVVHRGGTRSGLTELERRLLAYLAARPGRAVPRDALLTDVWGHTRPVLTRCVDSAVRRLREKIERDPGQPMHLVRVHGVGYRFDPVGHGVPARPASPSALPPGHPIRGRDAELERIGRWLHGGHRVVWVDGLPGSGRSALITAAAQRFGGYFPRVVRGLPAGAPAPGLYLCDPADPSAVVAALSTPGVAILGSGEAPAVAGLARLTVGPLPADSGALVLGELLGLAVDDRIREAAASVGAHPSALVEVAARWAAVRPGDDPDHLCPRTLAALAEVRRPECLRALAVFQGPFHPGETRAIADPDALVALTDAGWVALRSDGLLEIPPLARARIDEPDPADRAAHAAALLRRLERLRGDLRGPRRERALAALEASRADVDAALAHSDPALRLALLDPMSSWAHATGNAAWLGARLEALDPGGLEPVQRSVHLQLQSEVLRVQGRFDRARALAEAAVDQARRSGSTRELGMATGTLALVLHSARDLGPAEALYRDAAEALRDPDAVHVRARYLANLGQLLTELSRAQEAEPVLREVLALRVAGPDREAERRDRVPLASCLVDLGRTSEARFHLDQLPEGAVEALPRALILLEAGSLREVAAVVARGSAEAPTSRSAAILSGYLGVARWFEGDLRGAESALRTAVEGHQRAGQPDLGCVALAWLSLVEASAGRRAEAQQTWEWARDAAQRCAPWRFASDLVELLAGGLDVADGRLDEARARIDAVAEGAAHSAELRIAQRAVDRAIRIR